jgi:exosortase
LATIIIPSPIEPSAGGSFEGGAQPSVRARASKWAHPILLLVGVASLVFPTLFSLAREYWSTDNGVHGPLLLVSGLWLLWRTRPWAHSVPGAQTSTPAVLAAIAPLLLLYVYGRSMGVLSVESASLYLLLLTLAWCCWGNEALRRMRFPALYLAFLIRPPSGIVAELTQPLKIWISNTAADLLHLAGYEVASSGVKIQIAQYELLVQHACAGLGSIFSLLAIGLLYLHLAATSRGYGKVLLLASIIPLAVLANLLRVLLTILATIYFGEAAAKGLSHEATGILTFGLSLLGLFLFDQLIASVQKLKARPDHAR